VCFARVAKEWPHSSCGQASGYIFHSNFVTCVLAAHKFPVAETNCTSHCAFGISASGPLLLSEKWKCNYFSSNVETVLYGRIYCDEDMRDAHRSFYARYLVSSAFAWTQSSLLYT
jgi:hypothetical protein